MIEWEQSAASQTCHNIMSQIALLEPGQQDDPVILLLGFQQCFPNLQHIVRSQDMRNTKLELNFGWSFDR